LLLNHRAISWELVSLCGSFWGIIILQGSICLIHTTSHDWQETFHAVLFSLRTKLDRTQQEWDVPFAQRLRVVVYPNLFLIVRLFAWSAVSRRENCIVNLHAMLHNFADANWLTMKNSWLVCRIHQPWRYKPPPLCMPELFWCLGKASWASLSAIAQHWQCHSKCSPWFDAIYVLTVSCAL
jgi:hypothetical protein